MDRAQPNTWTTASVGGGRWDAFLGATSRPGVGQPHAYEKTIRAKDVTETGRAVGTIGAPPAPLAEPLAELRLRIAAAEGARKEREARREAQAERALRQREQAREEFRQREAERERREEAVRLANDPTRVRQRTICLSHIRLFRLAAAEEAL